MNWDKKIFLENIEKIVHEKCEGKQSLFNQAIGYRDAITKWKGANTPSIDTLYKICSTFDCDLFWLLTGNGQPSTEDTNKKQNLQFVFKKEYVIDALAKDFNLIPKYKAKLSGGTGSLVQDNDISSYFAFRRDWLHNRHGGPQNKVLFLVSGDSMAPTINDGDIVMVDQNQTEILDGKIYAFSEGEAVKVKRLARLGKTLMVSSDNKLGNPDYPADTDTTYFNIIGRVIWVGHEV